MAHAGEIGPGSPAPALDVKTWYKGTPVKSFDKNKTYVVEFWATWCGPCIESIPHVTKLAKENKDVTFIGVSIWEEDKDGNIKKFIDDMGEKMDYNVGYSGNKTGMSESWMMAAGQNGIPSAFIVKNGQIQWVGHPMTMDQPLKEIKAGTFDLKGFKSKFDKQADANRQAMAARSEISAAQKLVASGDLQNAKLKVAGIEKQYPAMKMDTDLLKFAILAKENPTQWEAEAKAIAIKKDPSSLQKLWMFAMNQSRGNGDIVNGSKAMDLALEANQDKDAIILYYGVTFFNEVKEFKKALGIIDRLLAALPNSDMKDNVKFKEAMEKMRGEIAAKANNG